MGVSVLSICQCHYSVFIHDSGVKASLSIISVFPCGSACSAWKSFKEKLIQKLKYCHYLAPPYIVPNLYVFLSCETQNYIFIRSLHCYFPYIESKKGLNSCWKCCLTIYVKHVGLGQHEGEWWQNWPFLGELILLQEVILIYFLLQFHGSCFLLSSDLLMFKAVYVQTVSSVHMV